MSDIIKDNDYYERKLSEWTLKHLKQVDAAMVAFGATKEERIAAIRAAERNLNVQMISVGQKPSTN